MEQSKRSEDGPPPRKKLKTIQDNPNQTKNPVMALNEIKPNLVYDITDKGPAHAKIYSASVSINGKVYNAEDTTKKKAKARVAQMILQLLCQLRDPSVKSDLNLMGNNEDFSQDLSEMVNDSQDFFCFETAVVNTVKTVNPLPNPNLSAESAKNNPVYCLNKVKPGIKIEITKQEGSPHCMIYTACGNNNIKICVHNYSTYFCFYFVFSSKHSQH